MQDNKHQEGNFDNKEYQSAAFLFHTGNEFTEKCKRQTGDDPDHDDEGNTVTDSFIRDLLTEPHDKHGTGGKHDYGRNSRRMRRWNEMCIRIERSNCFRGKL